MTLRPRLSPTMDRFFGAQFFGPFVVCLCAFTIAYLLGDVLDRFNDLIQYGGFGLLGLEYFSLKIPLIVSQLLPVACLAGVLLGFALLNRSGEVQRVSNLASAGGNDHSRADGRGDDLDIQFRSERNCGATRDPASTVPLRG